MSPVRPPSGGGSPTGGLASRRSADGDRFNIEFLLPGHGNRREGILKAVQRYDNVGGLNLNQAVNVPVWLATVNRRDDDFFPPIGSFLTRVYVSKTGTYRVSYNVVARNTGVANGNVRCWVAKNGNAGTALVGSAMAFTTVTNLTDGSASTSFLTDLTAGDYLEIYATRSGALTGVMNTVAGASFMQVELVSYPGESYLGGARLAPRPGYVELAVLTKGVSGYSGTTYVDVLKNGSTMLGSIKLSIASTQQYQVYPESMFSVKSFDVNDTLSIALTATESPYPRDFSLILRCKAAN